MSPHAVGEATLPLDDAVALGVQRGLPVHETPGHWRLSTFAGRLGEISGSHAGAALTLVFRLVHEAQRNREPVAWIARGASTFFPPDADEAGVDLAALPVIRVPETIAAARAADHLVRSGGFGLVVLDLGEDARMPVPVQARLVGLAQKHGVALLCLTQKENHRSSLGSLVSLRAEARRLSPRAGDRFECRAQALKDKRRGPGWSHTEVCHGPDGLC